LFFTLRNVFAQRQSLRQLQSVLRQYDTVFPDKGLLGTFIDNHDQARFLSLQPDVVLYQNALVYVLLSQGIPIVYYGTEQAFSGGSDPQNREPLWQATNGAYNTSAALFQFISQLNILRKQWKLWTVPQVERYADDTFYAFTRGSVLVLLTNVGANGTTIVRTISFLPYENGQNLCNVFNQLDCIQVANNVLHITLQHGESKVYLPK